MEFKLNELTYIGKQFEHITDISLFKHIQKPLEGDEVKSLEERHVINKGKLTEPLNLLFKEIAEASRSARLIIRMPGLVMEKSVYTNGNEKVLVENKGGKVTVSLLEKEMDRIRFEVSEHLGMSMQQHSVFQARLTPEGLMVLLGIVDWVRRESMLSYAGAKEIGSLTEEVLADYLQKPMENGLMGLLRRTYDLPVQPVSVDKMKSLLANFMANGWLIVEEGEISLNRELMDFALNFSIVEAQVLMEAFQLNEEGNILNANMLVLTAGLKDLAAFAVADDAIELNLINSSTMLNWAESYLNCPEL